VTHNKVGQPLRPLIDSAVEVCAQLVQRHPRLWKLAWGAIHQLPFLLPHDKSYRALRHFVALKPEGLFLDIGANDGISALSFRRFSRSYRILSLEPNALLEPALKKLKASDPHFDYRMIGAGAVAARVQFFVPLYKNIVLHTFTSNNRGHILAAIDKSFGASIANDVTIEAFDCDIIPIDSLDINPSIIKIDAEGFDYEVIEGLKTTIQRTRPFIMIEIADSEYDHIKNYLSDRHYVLLTYNIFSDTFSHAPVILPGTQNATFGHRNFFAVPEDFLGSLHLK
jgi:FkbM family methyltransferase